MKEVTDELIATYLSGNATEEEGNLVLNYMAENEEHLDDLLAVADALRVQQESTLHKHRPLKESNVFHPLRKASIHRFRPVAIYSVAASVVLLLIVGGIWLLVGGGVSSGGEQMAIMEPQPSLFHQNNTQNYDIKEDDLECYIIQERPATQTSRDYAECKQKTKPVYEMKNEEDDWIQIKTFDFQQDIALKENPSRPSVLMAASTLSPQKNNKAEELSSDEFTCVIPSQWMEGDSLKISWQTSARGVRIDLMSADGYRYSEIIEDGRTSVVFFSMWCRFFKHGRYMDCSITNLSDDSKAVSQKGIIELIKKK